MADEDYRPSAAETARLIDGYFERHWQAENVTPAPAADDGEFLRRLSLDLTGAIPTAGEAREFLADESPDKRHRRLAELLASPKHAAHLASVWRELLLPKTVGEDAYAGFENWLAMRFAANEPYDRLVSEILLARGSVGQSPPALFFAAHNTKPQELAASSSRVFLGIQIRCAECHDHPFASWKQDDFWSLAAFFARTRGPSSEGGQPRVEDVADGEVTHPKTMQTAAPRLPGGEPIDLATAEPRRAVLARWMTSPENPYFASAAVNRAWWLMFGRGLSDPVDDMGDHATPAQGAVLQLLSDDFKSSGYDLRRVFDVLARTRAYRLSSATKADADAIDPLTSYSSMPVRSLSARQVYECLLLAAGMREPLSAVDPAAQKRSERRADLQTRRGAGTRQGQGRSAAEI
jgi:hypothetical protein